MMQISSDFREGDQTVTAASDGRDWLRTGCEKCGGKIKQVLRASSWAEVKKPNQAELLWITIPSL
jgi:hypothetical protein